MPSKTWSSTTLQRGVDSLEEQPMGKLSQVKLEKDEDLRSALQVPCHGKMVGAHDKIITLS